MKSFVPHHGVPMLIATASVDFLCDIQVTLHVATPVAHTPARDGLLDVAAGQAVNTHAGEWVRYSTPHPDGAEYLADRLPAFSPQTVNWDSSQPEKA